MKNIVKIASIEANKEFTNKNGIKQHTLRVLLLEPILSGRIVTTGEGEDASSEKVMKMTDSITIQYKDFLKIIVLDDGLAQLDPEKSDNEDWKENIDERFHYHFRILKGASLTIDREEITGPVFELDDGEIRLDDDGNPVVKMKDGQPVTKVIGFGGTSYTELKLSDAGKRSLASRLEKQDE